MRFRVNDAQWIPEYAKQKILQEVNSTFWLMDYSLFAYINILFVR
jgi:hypothetical protein